YDFSVVASSHVCGSPLGCPPSPTSKSFTSKFPPPSIWNTSPLPPSLRLPPPLSPLAEQATPAATRPRSAKDEAEARGRRPRRRERMRESYRARGEGAIRSP